MTISLVARCAETGMFGVAISSSSPAVAARCSFARAGVGAVATQNVTDPSLGPLGLDALQRGCSAQEAIAEIKKRGHFIAYRQVLVVDTSGRTAIHSGEQSLGVWNQAQDDNVASGGNLLAHDGVPQAMVSAFLKSSGHLGDRLLTALRAGLASGGEAGPLRSAGLKVVDKVSWPIVDLRCDWTMDCPIEAIGSAWDVCKPQIDDYVRRALDPRSAPSYGVPGDR